MYLSCLHPSTRTAICLTTLMVSAGFRAPAAPTPSLSLPEVLQRVTDLNPALSAERFRERAAAARIEQANLRPNPTLDLSLENFVGTGALRGIDGLEATVQANQLLERGNKREKRVALASTHHDITTRTFAVRQADILAATAEAYLATLGAQQRVAFATEPLQLARRTLDAVEARLAAAVASPAEVARARAALATARSEAALAEAALTRTRTALAALWGGTLDDVPTLTGNLQVPATLPAMQDFLARLPDHPRIDLAEATVARGRASLELAQAHAVQDISISGGVKFFREGSDAALVAGVSVPLPIRNKNQGNIRAARESLSGAELTVTTVRVELRAAFNAAWQDLVAAHQQATAIRNEVLPPTQEAAAVVREAYDQGQLPLIDLLDAQRALIDLQRQLLETAAAYGLALARIDALTDSSFPSLVSLINRP